MDNYTFLRICVFLPSCQFYWHIIAHRLSTIINCDNIIMIDDGKVIASGTHKELLKKSKEYKKLCDTEIIESGN